MTSAECIHGFDQGLCDICFPKKPVVPPRAIRASRAATPVRAPRPAQSRSASSAPPVSLLDQRVFHVTHVRNFEGIIGAGGLVAGERPEVDLSSDLARELRATAEVAPGEPVSEYVPWYLSADATVWNELRAGASDPRWSAAARAVAPSDLVVLVSTVRDLTASGTVVVADGDAAGTYTRFAAESDQVLRMLSRLHNAEEALGAELLVKALVPFEAVQVIGVANDPARDRVRSLLTGASITARVSVYPPWFVPSPTIAP